MISQLLFACPEVFFWWFLAETFFLFFHFWTLTVRFLQFFQKRFNMSEHFSAAWPKFFERHVSTAFNASIQTLRNLLSDLQKDSASTWKKFENFKNSCNMRKTPRVKCFSTRMLNLQSMCPFKQVESFCSLNNRESFWDKQQKFVRTPENAFGSDFKTAFFSAGESFEQNYCS